MSPNYTSRIVVCTVLMFAGLCAVRSLSAQGGATTSSIVLENFAAVRMNLDSPAQPLFQPYLYPSQPDYTKQTGAIENGTYHLWTAGRPYFQFLPYPYRSPKGWAKQNLLSGTWDTNVNRLSFWIKSSRSISRRSDGGTIAEFGTYTKPATDTDPNNQGDHWYHYLDPNFIANQWMLVTLNRVPTHLVSAGSDPTPSYPENPTASKGWNYFDGLTRFYFSDEYGNSADWNGDYYFADFRFGIVNGEPDTFVSTVTAVYTGDHYEISWEGSRNVVQKYTVYMSTASMKSTGLGGATVMGTGSSQGYAYAGVIVQSAKVAQPAGGMYFAIQPAGQSNFTEIYLPVGPNGTSGAPPPPVNLRIVK